MNKFEFSDETLNRVRTLFPTNYQLTEYVRNNDLRALDLIREMEVEPYIHVNDILLAVNTPTNSHGINWGIISLRNQAERIADIIALEELMMDETGIMEINN